MKISDVKAYVLRSALEQPFAFSQGWVSSRGATLVEVTTDDGITGWGEALCQGLQPPEIAAAAVLSALRPLVLGADPLEPEVLWHRMYHQTRDFGLKGAVIGAISGVDIALWDICGKAHGAPVAQLLGGLFRDKVQAYSTGFYRIKGQGEAARLAAEAKQRHAEGFRAMKFKLGFGIEEQGWNLRWYEEPVTQEDLGGYAEVRRALATPIAGGENEFTLFGFRELFARRAVDIAQPDICAAGGFTGCRHIVSLAHSHGVQVNPHVWGSAVGQAASLQLIASIPDAHHSLFASQPLLEFDMSAHPFRERLTDRPLRHKDGWVDVPRRPGLGIEVSREVLRLYCA